MEKVAQDYYLNIKLNRETGRIRQSSRLNTHLGMRKTTDIFKQLILQ